MPHENVEAHEYRDLGDCVSHTRSYRRTGSWKRCSRGRSDRDRLQLRNGRIARTRAFLDHAEAFKAVGLEG